MLPDIVVVVDIAQRFLQKILLTAKSAGSELVELIVIGTVRAFQVSILLGMSFVILRQAAAKSGDQFAQFLNLAPWFAAAQEAWPRAVGMASALVSGLGWLPGGIGAAVTGLVADRTSLATALYLLLIPTVIGLGTSLIYTAYQLAFARQIKAAQGKE